MFRQSPNTNKHLSPVEDALRLDAKAKTGYPAAKPTPAIASAFARAADTRHTPKGASPLSPRVSTSSPESASPQG